MDHESLKSSFNKDSVKDLEFCPPQGSGPGLLLVDTADRVELLTRNAKQFSEEGYCVIALPLPVNMNRENLTILISSGLARLKEHPQLVGKIGAIFYDSVKSSQVLESDKIEVDCAVIYSDDFLSYKALQAVKADSIICHSIKETRGADSPRTFYYPDCERRFFDDTDKAYDKPATSMAYSRTLGLLRSKLGPNFDIQSLWEKHTNFEFAERDVDKTMETMVAEPYVNHIPTMTGGVGYENLHHFYTNHFVNSNPPDTKLIPVSRTIGIDRLVDEMIFSFTHTCEIPWMLPNVAPTGRYVEVPLVAIVNFRGDKLYHEHIYWDQASVLVQIGKLDPSLLPVAGIETAKKLIDETLPSNQLMSK